MKLLCKSTSAPFPPFEREGEQCPRHFPALCRPWSQVMCLTARIFWLTVDMHMQLS